MEVVKPEISQAVLILFVVYLTEFASLLRLELFSEFMQVVKLKFSQVTISYPAAMLNAPVQGIFTNDQARELIFDLSSIR